MASLDATMLLYKSFRRSVDQARVKSIIGLASWSERIGREGEGKTGRKECLNKENKIRRIYDHDLGQRETE